MSKVPWFLKAEIHLFAARGMVCASLSRPGAQRTAAATTAAEKAAAARSAALIPIAASLAPGEHHIDRAAIAA
jgi:hypothetical protein